MKHDNFYIAGLILIIIGTIILLIPWFFIFGIPVFLLGVIFAWLSRTTLLRKLLMTLVPIVICPLVYALFLNFGTAHVTPATYLIPENFRGKIRIFYEEPCGQKLQMVDERNIFNIPDNGILILQNKLETGIVDNEYYFADKKGNKIRKIDEMIQQDFNEDYTTTKNEHEPSRNKIGLFFGGTAHTTLLNEKEQTYEYMFVLCWDSMRVFKEAYSDSLAQALIHDCREKAK